MSTSTLISRPPEAVIPVRVNGVEISAEAIAAETQHHPAQRPEAAWQAAASALAIREALLQRARALGLAAEPLTDADGRKEAPDDALIRAMLDAEVTTPEPDEASCRRYYDNNREKLRAPDLYEPAHILLQADSRDEAAFERALAEARTLLETLCDKPDLFARMARDRSDCASATEGGRLGQVMRGQTTPAFEAVLAQMQPGAIHPEPVETAYGVHIIRLDHAVRGEIPAFEQARPLVEEFLRDASWRRAVSQFISLIIGDADVSGVDLKGAQSPLVQ
jgi:peptidyl-prolyl cis-trans isomerase C